MRGIVGRRRIRYIKPLKRQLCGKDLENIDFEPEIDFPLFGLLYFPEIRPSCYPLLNISDEIFGDDIGDV
jgi:hypothetical protein